jgi:hypothetical protein
MHNFFVSGYPVCIPHVVRRKTTRGFFLHINQPVIFLKPTSLFQWFKAGDSF